jgi:hypothetical protein
MPVDPPHPEGGRRDSSKDEVFFVFFCLKVNDFTRELKMDIFSRLEEDFRQKKFKRIGYEMC